MTEPTRHLVKYYTGAETKCKCGQHIIPASDYFRYNWYWHSHSKKNCTLELPDIICWCGLKRSEHMDGHNR